MSLQKHFFTTLFFIVGFISVPILLLLFFVSLRAMEPTFWTKGISAAGFISGFIEEKLPKKIPMPLQRNLKIAKDSIEASIDAHVQPQIELQLKGLKSYIQGESYFPSLAFNLVRLKQDIEKNIREASLKQKFSDTIVVNLALNILPSVPDKFVVGDYVKIQNVKDFTEKNKSWLSFTLRYPYLFPIIVVLFFILFLISTLDIRSALYNFSNMMIFSGLCLAFFSGLGLLALQFYDPMIKTWLLKHSLSYYSISVTLPSRVLTGLTKYLVSTFCVNGLIAAGSSIFIGILFFAKKKKSAAVLKQV